MGIGFARYSWKQCSMVVSATSTKIYCPLSGIEGIFHLADAPSNIVLKRQFRRPLSFVFYAVFLIGMFLLFCTTSKIVGAAIAASTVSVFISWRRNIWARFKRFCMLSITGDMADIGKRYGAPPSAFWVAKIAAGGQAAGTIIGCIGLGMYFIACRSF